MREGCRKTAPHCLQGSGAFDRQPMFIRFVRAKLWLPFSNIARMVGVGGEAGLTPSAGGQLGGWSAGWPRLLLLLRSDLLASAADVSLALPGCGPSCEDEVKTDEEMSFVAAD